MLNVQECALPEVKLLRPRDFKDSRGTMAEVAQDQRFQDLGLPRFVQENQSLSTRAGTVRGLHFQKPPAAQAKLVRVLRGKIFDVAVDVRPKSPTFGQHVSVTLSDDELVWMYIPAGFAHGFCTLTDDVQVLYKVSTFYAPATEGGIIWNDPALAIAWPATNALLSDKDTLLPLFKDLPNLDW